MKALIISNCVATSYADALKAICPEWDVRAVDAGRAEEWLASGDKPDFVEFLQTCDLYIGSPLDRRKYADQLHQKADRIIIPDIWFHGLHPDISYSADFRGPLSSGTINTQGSLITFAARALDIGAEATCKLFSETTYAEFGYFERYAKERTKLLETFAASGIDLTDDVPGWEASGDFFLVPHHPRKIVVADILRRALLGRYIDRDVHAATQNVHRTLVDRLAIMEIWPVYPELASRIGFAGSLVWRRPGQGGHTELPLDAFVAASFQALDAMPATWRAAPHVENAATILRGLLAKSPRPSAAQQPVPAPAPAGQPAQPAAQPAAKPAPADPDLPGRWLTALLAWDALRAQLPDQPATYRAFVTALTKNGQLQQAEIVLGEAAKRFYTNAELAADFARAAEQRRDWTAAHARWEHVRALFPQLPLAHIRVGALLRKELGRPDEADKVLETAAARFPNRVEVWTEFAASAADRDDRPAAIQRYQVLRERFPTVLIAWLVSARLLREEQRFDEADSVVADALVRFPDDASLMQERAWIAHRRADWQAAVLRWAALRTVHPDTALAYWKQAEVLIDPLGRLDEAEELLSEAILRFPNHADIAAEHARLAEKRGDAAEARQRWATLAERSSAAAGSAVAAG